MWKNAGDWVAVTVKRPKPGQIVQVAWSPSGDSNRLVYGQAQMDSAGNWKTGLNSWLNVVFWQPIPDVPVWVDDEQMRLI